MTSIEKIAMELMEAPALLSAHLHSMHITFNSEEAHGRNVDVLRGSPSACASSPLEPHRGGVSSQLGVLGHARMENETLETDTHKRRYPSHTCTGGEAFNGLILSP